jgi:hypothetical protein
LFLDKNGDGIKVLMDILEFFDDNDPIADDNELHSFWDGCI